MKEFRSLSDQDLLESTRHAARVEREATTEVLHRLREVERRRLFVDLGFPSLFEYAVGDLKYSAPSAQRRIDAMRLLRDLPELEEKLQSGSLSLSVLSQAQKFFRTEAKIEKPLEPRAKLELLAELEGKSTREVDRELVSRSSEPLAMRRETVRVVTETHSELKFLATKDTLDQMETTRGLLGHSHSELSLGELVAVMAKIALEKLDPARDPKRARLVKSAAPSVSTAAAPKDQAAQSVPAPESSEASGYDESRGHEGRREHIPAQVRRGIWKRAEGKCVLCRGIYRLQVDHIHPVAKGGTNTPENLRLLCFHCNQRQADLKLGRDQMERLRMHESSA